MYGTRYKRGKVLSMDMAACARAMNGENGNAGDLSRLKQDLARALQSEVTPRQREMLTLYYVRGLNMRQIGELLGVDKSTVSRTLKRGRGRLKRCLRYASPALLRETARR